MDILDPTGQPMKPRQQEILVIPWDAYIAFGIHVAHEGDVKVAVFAPKPELIETPEDGLNLMRFIMSAQAKKPGPVDWSTVPESVRSQFTFTMPEGVPTGNGR